MKITATIFPLIILGNTLYAMDGTDYINEYFPDDSMVKNIHNSEPHGTGFFELVSSARSHCDRINYYLSAATRSTYPDYNKAAIRFSIICIAGGNQTEIEWAEAIYDYLREKSWRESESFQVEARKASMIEELKRKHG